MPARPADATRPEPSGAASSRASVLCGAALGLACFAYLVAWPPTLNSADESFTLYGAKRVLQGQALYRDFFDFLTPGSFYLYALAYALGGVSITTAKVTTALLNAVSAVCTYALALHVASRAEALLAGLLVVVLCVPAWNMASHHWIATCFGLASAAVLLAKPWWPSARLRPALAGALAGLLVCTHQSRGVGMIAWLGVVAPVLALAHAGPSRWRDVLRELTWIAIGGAIPCVGILGWAAWQSSVAELLQATHTWVVTNYRHYNVGTIPWAGYGIVWAGGLKYTSRPLMLALPWLLALEAVLLPWMLWRRGWRATVPRAAILLLTLGAIASILYFPDYVHVAFVMPYALVVMAGLVHQARTALPVLRRGPALAALRVAWLALAAGIGVKAWQNLGMVRAENPVHFETAYGTIAAGKVQAGTVRELREHLQPSVAAPAHLFAYPSDAWLYLVLPADNPTPFALLRPVYNTDEQIQSAIDGLKRDPRALVLVNSFGVFDGDPFMEWLRQHYEDVMYFPEEAGHWKPYALFVPAPAGQPTATDPG